MDGYIKGIDSQIAKGMQSNSGFGVNRNKAGEYLKWKENTKKSPEYRDPNEGVLDPTKPINLLYNINSAKLMHDDITKTILDTAVGEGVAVKPIGTDSIIVQSETPTQEIDKKIDILATQAMSNDNYISWLDDTVFDGGLLNKRDVNDLKDTLKGYYKAQLESAALRAGDETYQNKIVGEKTFTTNKNVSINNTYRGLGDSNPTFEEETNVLFDQAKRDGYVLVNPQDAYDINTVSKGWDKEYNAEKNTIDVYKPGDSEPTRSYPLRKLSNNDIKSADAAQSLLTNPYIRDNYDVNSDKFKYAVEFLSNPEIQDGFYSDYYLPNVIDKRVKSIKDSGVDTSLLNENQLRYLVHHQGTEGAEYYLRNGDILPSTLEKTKGRDVKKELEDALINFSEDSDFEETKNRVESNNNYSAVTTLPGSSAIGIHQILFDTYYRNIKEYIDEHGGLPKPTAEADITGGTYSKKLNTQLNAIEEKIKKAKGEDKPVLYQIVDKGGETYIITPNSGDIRTELNKLTDEVELLGENMDAYEGPWWDMSANSISSIYNLDLNVKREYGSGYNVYKIKNSNTQQGATPSQTTAPQSKSPYAKPVVKTGGTGGGDTSTNTKLTLKDLQKKARGE